jgi:hypothetical protein
MKILDVLEVPDAQWREVVQIARDAAERGWWDSYGDTMGDRQRIYADIESGATTIREYQPGTIPGILQTPEYTWSLIERAQAEGPISYVPERMAEARLQRQRTALRSNGPEYEVILDEVGLRRFSVPPEVFAAQLCHIVKVAETEPRVSVRVFPLRTGMAAGLMPHSPLLLYTFPDPEDPPLVIEETVTTDLIQTQPTDVSANLRRYEYVRGVALSEVSSLSFLSSLADEITHEEGSES